VVQILWLNLQRCFFLNGFRESAANLHQALCSYVEKNLSKFVANLRSLSALCN
jgi:hypothetical protein